MIDNDCDQTIINISYFLAQSFASIHYDVGGNLNSMTPLSLELINEAFTLTILPDNRKVMFQISQAFMDRNPLQNEALLQPHQMRAFGTIVDDCAHRHIRIDGKLGGQCMHVGKTKYPIHFDGWKCYFRFRN